LSRRALDGIIGKDIVSKKKDDLWRGVGGDRIQRLTGEEFHASNRADAMAVS